MLFSHTKINAFFYQHSYFFVLYKNLKLVPPSKFQLTMTSYSLFFVKRYLTKTRMKVGLALARKITHLYHFWVGGLPKDLQQVVISNKVEPREG